MGHDCTPVDVLRCHFPVRQCHWSIAGLAAQKRRGAIRKEALNFAISMSIYSAIGYFLVLAIIGIFLLVGLFLFWVIVLIIAAVKANEGKPHRYPLSIRFIR